MIFYNRTHSSFAKKIAVFFVSILYFMSANGALAQGVVSDPVTEAETLATAVSVAGNGITTAAKFTWDAVTKNFLDSIAYAAGQKLLTQLTQSTVRWIQGGFHGSPSFRVDTDRIGTEIADDIAGNLALRLRGIATCDFTANYKDDMRNVLINFPKKRDYIFDNKATCPFKQTWNFSATQLYGETNRLTWTVFGAMLDDAGNPYGVQTITAKELQEKTVAAQAKDTQAASWSNGFADIKDMKDCTFPPELFTKKENILRDSLTDAQKQAEADAANEEMLKDPEFLKANKKYCKTTTPGKIVGDQLTKSTGIDFDKLGFADNMNKIVSAFMDQVMQKTVRGVFGKGNQSYSSGSIGDPLGGVARGGPPPCYVQVTTLSATTDITSATLKGSVTCADTLSNANVFVWFRWSNTSFSGNSSSATRVDVPLKNDAPPGTAENFSTTLTGLTPGTTYYYSANAFTSNLANAQQSLIGTVSTFTMP